MNLLFVSPSFYPAVKYGGPVYSSFGLCNALAGHEGVRLKVLTTNSASAARGDDLPVSSFPVRMQAGYEVYYCRRAVGADVAPRMFRMLPAMIRWADVVHLNAVYSPPTLPTLLLCKLMNKPVVWSLRGALQGWGGSRKVGLKRLWDKAASYVCGADRVALHCTSEEERRSSLGKISGARMVVIPNGVEAAQNTPERQWQPGGALRLMYLGRLHPIKGLENLLGAMAGLPPTTTLDVCGDGEDTYRHRLESMVSECGLGGRVRFNGLVEGAEKSERFGRADICVAPSHTENFGMAVAEALAHGVPVVASRGTPWARVEAVGCGLWVDNTPESLAKAISRMRTMPLREMGRRGREWMRAEFSWNAMAGRMHDLYQELGGAAR